MTRRDIGEHLEVVLDGRVFDCATVRNGMPVWARPDRIVADHADVVVIAVDARARELLCALDGEQVIVSDPMAWHDDGVRIRLAGFRAVAASQHDDGGEVAVCFVPAPALAGHDEAAAVAAALEAELVGADGVIGVGVTRGADAWQVTVLVSSADAHAALAGDRDGVTVVVAEDKDEDDGDDG